MQKDAVDIGLNGETVIVFLDSDLLSGSMLCGTYFIGDGVTITLACRVGFDGGDVDTEIQVSVTSRVTEDGDALPDVGPVGVCYGEPDYELLASAIVTAVREHCEAEAREDACARAGADYEWNRRGR